MTSPVIEVKGLKTRFFTNTETIDAVNKVDFTVPHSSTFAIVGESGSGKSATALSIMRLIPKFSGKIIEGSVMFGGRDILTVSEKEMTNIRGKEIGMIFQEPMTSLNPVMRIGDQISEVAMFHDKLTKTQARDKTTEMLNTLGISSPKTRYAEYPHQMSGGMKQRIMIAMALICSPRLLIADEPTTALDVTTQATIIDLIKRLQMTLKMSIMFITHDLAIVAEIANYIAVMYAGRFVELCGVNTFFKEAGHPYSLELLESLSLEGKKRETNVSVLNDKRPQSGCAYRNRCAKAIDACRLEEPALDEISDGHFAACWAFK